MWRLCCFFFNDTATTEIYTLSLHDALPICRSTPRPAAATASPRPTPPTPTGPRCSSTSASSRSEEHTSELQSRQYLVCRLLLEKKKNKITPSLVKQTDKTNINIITHLTTAT